MFDFHKIHKRLSDIFSGNIFFIVGVPKSGTTWMQHLLNGHPEIRCSGEEGYNRLLSSFEHVVNDYNEHMTVVNKKLGAINHTMFNRENLEYLIVASIGLLFNNFIQDSDVKCFGAKSPVMIEALNIYLHLLPNAKFIHIIRDGRDVVISAWIRNLLWDAEATKQKWPDFPNFVDSVAGSWASYVRRARSWGREVPERYFEFCYEDLHKNPDTIIRQVLEFLGVDASRKMVDLCRENAAFEKLSQGRKRGQEDRKSFFRKGIVGDWKNHFDQNSIEAFMKHGGDVLRELGYQ